MLAAEKALDGVSQHNRQHDTHMVARLIALGADKNIVDDEGCSALGRYFSAIRTLNDMNAALLNGPKSKADSTLKVMLTPAAGPTTADRNCADDH